MRLKSSAYHNEHLHDQEAQGRLLGTSQITWSDLRTAQCKKIEHTSKGISRKMNDIHKPYYKNSSIIWAQRWTLYQFQWILTVFNIENAIWTNMINYRFETSVVQYEKHATICDLKTFHDFVTCQSYSMIFNVRTFRWQYLLLSEEFWGYMVRSSNSMYVNDEDSCRYQRSRYAPARNAVNDIIHILACA